MTSVRPTPFDLVFDVMARDRFPEIRASLAETSVDPADRDAFLLNRHVVQVLRDIVPDEGVGEAVDQHVALLHNAYLFWDGGSRLLHLSLEQTERVLANGLTQVATGRGTRYIQFPERTIWAQVNEGQPHEPLDGVFVTPGNPDDFRVLGIFGMHPDRVGFSVAEVRGGRLAPGRRVDGTPLFAPVLPGGAAAGLYSVDGPAELVELGARALQMANVQ